MHFITNSGFRFVVKMVSTMHAWKIDTGIGGKGFYIGMKVAAIK